MRIRARFIAWTAIVVLLFVGQVAWLIALRGDRLLSSDHLLIGGQIAFALLLIAKLALLRTTPSDAIRLKPRTSAWLILSGAIVLQISAILAPLPVLSDDWVRYRLNGLAWLQGESPYATTPAQMQSRGDAIDALVPHAQTTSIYPPIAELAFAATRAAEKSVLASPTVLAGPSGLSPYRDAVQAGRTTYGAAAWKLSSVVPATLVTVVLLLILRRDRRSPWYAVLWGWNPLVIIESGGMGHIDSLGALFFACAIWTLSTDRSGRRTGIISGVLLGLSCGVKPFALLIAPLIAMRLRSTHRSWFAMALLATLLLIFGPILLHAPNRHGWIEAGARYSQHWEANGSAYELIQRTLGQEPGVQQSRAKTVAKAVGSAAVMITLVTVVMHRASVAGGGYALLLVALLASPVAYPWYLIWPLALIPLLSRGGWAALLWSGTASISYLLWREPTWSLPAWAVVAQYVPVYVVAVWEMFSCARARTDSHGVCLVLETQAPHVT